MVTSTSTSNSNTVLTMPIPGSRLAPEKYKGDYSKIRSFLSHYELLCSYHNVTTGSEKCETLIRYCSNTVRQVILGLTSYSNKDWTLLQTELLQLFDAERDIKRYRVRDLITFVKGSKNKSIRDLAKWKKYVRNFIMIAGWLLEQKKLTPSAHATYFWTGIPRVLRNRLEGRILAKDPTRDLAEPFSFDETRKAAEALFQRDRFDMNLVDSDEEEDRGLPVMDSDDSGTESDSEDDEGDNRYDRSYKHRKHRGHKKHQRADKESDEEEDVRRINVPRVETRKLGKEPTKQEEVESLINQMSGMHVGDPQYGLVYWKAIKLDADVRMVVPGPQLHPSSPPQSQNAPRNSYTPPRNPPAFQGRPRSQFQHQSPPHMSNTFQSGPMAGSPMTPPQRTQECFGCNELGHGINQCPRIQNLMRQNLLMKQPNGRITKPDGGWIPRMNNESLVEAVEREQRNQVQSNYVSISDETEFDEMIEDEMNDRGNEELEYDTEEEAESYLAVPRIVRLDDYGYPIDGVEVYPAERQQKSTTTARREVMDGVVIPLRNRAPKDVPRPATRNGAATRSQTHPQPPPTHTRPPPPPKPTAPAPQPIHRVPNTRPNKPGPNFPHDRSRADKENFRTPIDIDAPRYQGKNTKDSGVMEDVEFTKNRSQEPIKRPNQLVAPNVLKHVPNIHPFTHKTIPPHRQSAVSHQVAPVGVLNSILNSNINLSIGDLLGVSKDVTNLLIESLKLKPPTHNFDPAAPNATTGLVTEPTKFRHLSRNIKPGPASVATAYHTDTRGFLIKLQMECHGNPMTAIIDTGSQLNIVSQDACNLKVQLPVDLKSRIMMNDANGTSRPLDGLVTNVPLNCGGLSTMAALHVGSHVPFELLLGRPWQRGNYVSIDERNEGTYLMFRDPEDFESRYEILVQPDDEYYSFPFNPNHYATAGDYQYPDCFSVSVSSEEQAGFGNAISRELNTELNTTLNDDRTLCSNQTISATDCKELTLERFKFRKSIQLAFVLQFLWTAISHNLKDHEERKSKKSRNPENQRSIKSKIIEDSPVSNSETITTISTRPTQPIQLYDMSSRYYPLPAIASLPSLNSEMIDGTISAQDSLNAQRLRTHDQRTTPEVMLLGLDDLDHLERTGRSQELVISSRHAVNFGTSTDALGFPSQRIMALQCALFPDPNNKEFGTIIKYGSAEIRFYEGLGGIPPPNWGIPYVPSPSASTVSSTENVNSSQFTNNVNNNQATRLIPVHVHGNLIGYTGQARVPADHERGAQDLSSPPSYPAHESLPVPLPSPPTRTPTVLTRPQPSDVAAIHVLRQLLKGDQFLSPESLPEPRHRSVAPTAPPTSATPIIDLPPLTPLLENQDVLAPWTTLTPDDPLARSNLSNHANSSASSSLRSMPSLVSVLSRDEDGYSSPEEMDWEPESDSEEELEEGEVDELSSSHGSLADDEASEITRGDVASARMFMGMPFGRRSIYETAPTPQGLPTPRVTPALEHLPPTRPSSPNNEPLGNRVDPAALEAYHHESIASPTPRPFALGNHPLTRSKSRAGVRKPLFTIGDQPLSAASILNRVKAPLTRPRSPIKEARFQTDVQVYTVSVPPYDPALLPPGLEDTIRQRQLAREQSQTLQSNTETVPDSEPSRSPSYEPSQDDASTSHSSGSTALASIRTEPIFTINEPLVPTRPNTPDAEQGVNRHRRQLRSYTAMLKDASRVHASHFDYRNLPRDETPVGTQLSPSPMLSDAALSNRDAVIHHEPRLPAYPSPTTNLYVEDNLAAATDLDFADSDTFGLLRHGSTSPPVTVPDFPSTDDFSHPIPPLPYSHSFRQSRQSHKRYRATDERDIPIRERAYHGWGDFEYSRATARVKGYFNVDVRTMRILTTTAGTAPYYIKRFTILGGILEPYILPFLNDFTPNGMADIPPYRAHNWASRLAELHNLRHEVRLMVDDITKCLTHAQHDICTCPTIAIFKLRSGHLVPISINRASFLNRLHPNFNSAVTLREGAFIRTAIYILRETPSYRALADAADLLLRTANYDSWLITELLAMDCLGDPEKDDQALKYIEGVENERLTDLYEECEQYKRESAKHDPKDRAEVEALDEERGELEDDKHSTTNGRKRRYSSISSYSSDESDSDDSDFDIGTSYVLSPVF